MPRKPDDIPTSRLGRGARIGGYVAGQGARYVGTAATSLTKNPRERHLAFERRHFEAVDQLLAVLGTMKGPAMKLGQMLSLFDFGLLPDDVQTRFQMRLATLCDEAPAISWSKMEPVLQAALGGSIQRTLHDIDTEPIGTASIGQVYRATTLDGRDVAIKIQYPQIAAAARADLKNLAALLRVGSSFAQSIDTNALAREVSTRLLEELDYGLEARNAANIAAAYAGHPFIHVPHPILDLCGPTILVTEFVAGQDFSELHATDQGLRDHVGEALMRFYLGSMFRLQLFSGDPHPGNLRLLPDGKVAFLDFGSVKELNAGHVRLASDALAAASEHDGPHLRDVLAAHQALAQPETVTGDDVLALFDDFAPWLLADQSVRMTPRVASNAVAFTMAPNSPHHSVLSDQNLPVEWALMVRTVFMTAALLGQLGAEANWHRIGREWTRGEGASTPLGTAEQEYFACPRPLT